MLDPGIDPVTGRGLRGCDVAAPAVRSGCGPTTDSEPVGLTFNYW
jgi:hypothetical protein